MFSRQGASHECLEGFRASHNHVLDSSVDCIAIWDSPAAGMDGKSRSETDRDSIQAYSRGTFLLIFHEISKAVPGEGQYDITGSIVAYKTSPSDLHRVVSCFKSARMRSRMLVIDNSPSSGLAEICRSLDVDYHHTGRNIGFGAAHNIAFRAVKDVSKYHVVMNPDIAFDSEVLPELYEFCEANPAVGLVMPKIVYPDGSLQRLCKRLPTPFDIAARRLFPSALKSMFHRQLDNFELRQFDMERCLSVPFLSGCFMFLRVNALDQIGYFDPRFFMYFEDADLTRRIRQHYDTVYVPTVSVIHEHGRGTYKSWRLFLRSLESAVRYFNKWGWIFDQGRKSANRSCGPVEYLTRVSEPSGSR